mmetsp:Transcript_23151/g.48215  ORF Transcript_23151/g.48215 Transcript_23151/m.48215 type:complete len:229 (-) Transcript_23151:107-793(-)|eukprot:CAMPEP_0172457916 /NCGR_PEP_ID=MMETSP1065-20121228/25034_1 /TAXON_ID=265537 /ORGANISM="Amphiprora paludosa, Strain CCMP125" /LENGTH=228 /DNA_ID=CAMNT_0013211913 /DNA_START=52 /DNA_END=738 /DNA_ORIENTATION=-
MKYSTVTPLTQSARANFTVLVEEESTICNKSCSEPKPVLLSDFPPPRDGSNPTKIRFNEEKNEYFDSIEGDHEPVSDESRWYQSHDYDRFRSNSIVVVKQVLTSVPHHAGLWLRTMKRAHQICTDTRSEFASISGALSLEEHGRLADVYHDAPEFVGAEYFFLTHLRTERMRRHANLCLAIRQVQSKTLQFTEKERRSSLVSQSLSRSSRLFARETAKALSEALSRQQ